MVKFDTLINNSAATSLAILFRKAIFQRFSLFLQKLTPKLSSSYLPILAKNRWSKTYNAFRREYICIYKIYIYIYMLRQAHNRAVTSFSSNQDMEQMEDRTDLFGCETIVNVLFDCLPNEILLYDNTLFIAGHIPNLWIIDLKIDLLAYLCEKIYCNLLFSHYNLLWPVYNSHIVCL